MTGIEKLRYLLTDYKKVVSVGLTTAMIVSAGCSKIGCGEDKKEIHTITTGLQQLQTDVNQIKATQEEKVLTGLDDIKKQHTDHATTLSTIETTTENTQKTAQRIDSTTQDTNRRVKKIQACLNCDEETRDPKKTSAGKRQITPSKKEKQPPVEQPVESPEQKEQKSAPSVSIQTGDINTQINTTINIFPVEPEKEEKKIEEPKITVDHDIIVPHNVTAEHDLGVNEGQIGIGHGLIFQWDTHYSGGDAGTIVIFDRGFYPNLLIRTGRVIVYNIPAKTPEEFETQVKRLVEEQEKDLHQRHPQYPQLPFQQVPRWSSPIPAYRDSRRTK